MEIPMWIMDKGRKRPSPMSLQDKACQGVENDNAKIEVAKVQKLKIHY